MTNHRHLITFFFAVFVIALSVYFQNQLAQFKSLGLLGIFLINFIGNATFFLPGPAIATVVAGGVIYPAFSVAVASSLGATLGDMIGYLLGYSGKKLFIKNHHILFVVMRDIFQKYGTITVFAFALIPNPFFDIIGLLGGIAHYSPIKFFTLLLLGRTIRNILLASLGSLFNN